ncbi:MAG: hypothetical protein N4A59_08835 [Marinifilum sp.]|jgi:hypothetical protein|nr:hypothetical protein [Marinifilum sp.]
MKKIVCLFVIICFSYNKSYSDNNYISYYKECNKAKLLIVNNQFSEALDLYQQIFLEYDKNFYKDIHNACLCAIRCEKYNIVLELAEKLVLHGYSMDDFKSKAFLSFRESQEWKKFNKAFPKLQKQFKSKLNLDLRRKYYQIFLEDQNIVSNGMGYGTEENDRKLIELSKKLHNEYIINGMPNFLHYKDTMNLKYFILHRHYFGVKNNAKNNLENTKDNIYQLANELNWKSILLAELKKGNIDPQFFANAVTYNDYKRPYGKPALKIDFEKEKVLLHMNLKPDEMKLKNENRKAIGLLQLNENNSDILKNSWYSKYPFQKIKDSLKLVTNPNPMAKLKVIRKFESDIRKTTPKSELDDFFLGNLSEIKETHFHGLTL